VSELFEEVDAADSEAIGKLVDEDPFLVGEGRHHAGALHLDRLIDEDYEDNREKNGQRQIAQPESGGDNSSSPARRFFDFLVVHCLVTNAW